MNRIRHRAEVVAAVRPRPQKRRTTLSLLPLRTATAATAAEDSDSYNGGRRKLSKLGMTLSLVGVALICSTAHLFAETDAEITARRNALDVAGAFTNDGFKLRDGHWCGTAKTQDHALIAVNLFAGNQYWFAVGTADTGRKIEVNVYDESGKLITTDHYQAGDRAAAGFSPTGSGQYFVAVDLAEGEPTNFCLIYSYK